MFAVAAIVLRATFALGNCATKLINGAQQFSGDRLVKWLLVSIGAACCSAIPWRVKLSNALKKPAKDTCC